MAAAPGEEAERYRAFVERSLDELRCGLVLDNGGWPLETKNTPTKDHCRKPIPLEAFRGRRIEKDKALEVLHQRSLNEEELIGLRLYTVRFLPSCTAYPWLQNQALLPRLSPFQGPMFEKYNAVLRGLQSESPFLRNK